MADVRGPEKRILVLTISRRLGVPLACGLIAMGLAAVGATKAVEGKGGDVTALVGVTATEPLAREARRVDPAFAFSTEHLDGAYFYAIALDPLARGDAHTLVDVPAYRFGHPGYGWLSWIVAGGRSSALPNTMLLVGLVGMFGAGFGASLVARELGWSPWGGLVVALNPGLLFATLADNSEPLATAILAAALLAWLRERVLWAGIALLALCLVKEQFVLVPLGLAIWEVVQRRRGRTGDRTRRQWFGRAAALLAGPLALGAWFVYLRSVYEVWPFEQHPLLRDPFAFPPTGYLDTLRRAAELHIGGPRASAQLRGVALPLLLAVGAIVFLGVVRALRMTSPLDPVYALLGVLFFSLTWVQLLYPKDLIRIASVQLALVPAALAGRRARPKPSGDGYVMRS